MYAKLINGNPVRLQMPLKINGNDVFTNDESIFIANGYKTVVFSDMPSENSVSHWEETENQIIQVWEEVTV